jgi:hypothetical protein
MENNRSTSQLWRVVREWCEGLASHWLRPTMCFEPGFLAGDGEGHRALNHVRIVRRTKIGTLDVLQRVGHTLHIAYVGDRNLGPLRLQVRAAAIFSVHQRADRVAGLQQFSNDNAARFSGCASHYNPWLSHERLLLVHIKCLIAVQSSVIG